MQPTNNAAEPLLTLVASLGISFLAYKITASLIPKLGDSFVQKGLKGKDLLKGDGGPGRGKEIPESMGVICASVYILLLSLFAPLPYLSHLLNGNGNGNGNGAYGHLHSLEAGTKVKGDQGIEFPHHSLSAYLASLLSLLIATFLGFLDDVFDIRWRYKLPIPIIASMPLLVVYFAGFGGTDVVLPKVGGLRSLFGVEAVGGVLKLGPLYYLYMSLLSTFCTNSINILAGVNGVEVIQGLVIAISIALNDILFLQFDLSPLFVLINEYLPSLAVYFPQDKGSHQVGFGLARGSPELADRHLFSLYLMLPMIAVCAGLLKHNWYPARAFVGDTFCYFSGMAFAVVGIMGHFSKTLLLFFIPQIFNFLYSCPQLFGIVPCPRHRLPKYNPLTRLLEPSQTHFPHPPTFPVNLLLGSLSAVGLLKVTRSRSGHIISCTNFTILNLILVIFGPMREESLTWCMVGVQIMGSALAFTIRYAGTSFFYDANRR